jgi:lysophospholipase L1-like esterase
MKFIYYCLFLLFTGSLEAQLINDIGVVVEVEPSSKLENTDSSLTVFKQKIKDFNKGEIKKVKIFHFGDSHIQPNNLTGETRQYTQTYFGNAGRGLVFPYSLANTNGPKDYTITSTVKWTNSWCINYPHRFDLGIAGMGVQSLSKEGAVNVNLNKDTASFTKVKATVIYSMEDPENGKISLNNVSSNSSTEKKFDTLSVDLNDEEQSLNIVFSGSKITIHGLYYENNQSGIVYNSAGVAGARYKDFNKTEYFTDQLGILNPDLVIISLGTNESYDSNYNGSTFESEVDTMLCKLKRTVPNVNIILTLPSENYKMVNGKPIKNYTVEKVSEVLRSQALKHNCAIWDLYTAMGGDGSMLEWYDKGWVNKDHVHFLKAGYKEQGYLLFEAIYKTLEESKNN